MFEAQQFTVDANASTAFTTFAEQGPRIIRTQWPTAHTQTYKHW